MISEFRSVLAQTTPEDMIRDFEGAVNRSLYYMAEGLVGYKGWFPAIILHTEKVPFGFLNLGYKNTLNMSANSQGVAVLGFDDLVMTLRDATFKRTTYMSAYMGVISPDKKTAFLNGTCTQFTHQIFKDVLISLANTLDAPTFKVWASISDKETPLTFKRRSDEGDFDTPDLDDLPAVIEKLQAPEIVAREITRMVYALDMESRGVLKALSEDMTKDLSPETLKYLDRIMFNVINVKHIYENMASYQTF